MPTTNGESGDIEIVTCPQCGAEAEAQMGPRGAAHYISASCDCELTCDEEQQMKQAARDAFELTHRYLKLRSVSK